MLFCFTPILIFDCLQCGIIFVVPNISSKEVIAKKGYQKHSQPEKSHLTSPSIVNTRFGSYSGILKTNSFESESFTSILLTIGAAPSSFRNSNLYFPLGTMRTHGVVSSSFEYSVIVVFGDSGEIFTIAHGNALITTLTFCTCIGAAGFVSCFC